MIILTPEAVDERTFQPYGTVYDLMADSPAHNVIKSAGDGYRDSFIANALIDRPGSLGMTSASPLPYNIGRMERHLHTQEAMMCAGEPIAFLVAPAMTEPPAAADVRAFLLMPGQVVVLHRGTWHSAAYGIHGPASYYWMAEAYDEEPTIWKPIEMGPVQLVPPLLEE